MTNATGFLLRTNLSDTGTLPRSGGWTGCPDIIPAGPIAISSSTLVSTYGSATDLPLQQGMHNNLYLRAKNMNSTSLTQLAYMFQVPGSLVLYPESWYSATNLVGYNVAADGDGSPDSPTIIAKYGQTLTAGAGQIAVSNAYDWVPQTTEHHCLVAVVANSWDDVLANYVQANSMEALAQWIYGNPSMGWHNVNIVPLTSHVYQNQVAFSNPGPDESATFTIVANKVPVGAKVMFQSNSSTSAGSKVGIDWTPVTAPLDGGSINPDFEVGTTLQINSGYSTVFTYSTDFGDLPIPPDFAMSIKVTTPTTPPPPPNSHAARFMRADSLEKSFQRSHSANALFVSPSGEVHGTGLAGYQTMQAAARFAGPGGNPKPITPKPIVTIGSHTTTPTGR
jgi:hypothetical protein